MLEKLLQYIKKNKKIILIFLGVFIFFYLTDFSFAKTPADNTSTTQDNQEISNLVKAADGIFVFIATLLGLVTQLVGLFLNPAWTSGSVFGLTEKIHDLWILISNIVYFIFMLILIAIAFMNIIGQGKGVFELKQALPRFIIGILMVPFSWVFINGLLAISSVLTAAVLSLPFETFQNTLAIENLEKVRICTDKVITHNTGLKIKDGVYGQDKNANPNKPQDPVGIVYVKNMGNDKQVIVRCNESKTVKQILNDPNGIYGILNIYTYGIMALDETMKTYSASLGSKITTLFSLLIKIGFDGIFALVYLILIIALFFALFIRGIRLWLYMIFSPVFGLLIFFGKGTSGFEAVKNFSIKELVALAMVPVYVAGALSFGLTFIVIAGHGMGMGEANLIEIIPTGQNGVSTLKVLGTYTLTIDGDFSNVANVKETTAFNQIIGGGMGIIGALLMHLFSIVVLWIGVMSALKASEITKSITDPLRNFGNKMGELMLNAPKYVPLPGTKLSLDSVTKAGSQTIEAYKYKQTEKAHELAKTMKEFLHISDEDQERAIKASNDLLRQLKSDNKLTRESVELLRKIYGYSKNITNFANNQDSVKALAEALKVGNVEVDGKILNAQDLLGDTNLVAKATKELESAIDKNGNLGKGIFPEIDGKNNNTLESPAGVNRAMENLRDELKTSSSSTSSSSDSKYNSILNAKVTKDEPGLKTIEIDEGTIKIDKTAQDFAEDKYAETFAKALAEKLGKGEKISKEKLKEELEAIGISDGDSRKYKDIIEDTLKNRGIKIIDENYSLNNNFTITTDEETDTKKITIKTANNDTENISLSKNEIKQLNDGKLEDVNNNDKSISKLKKYLIDIRDNGKGFSSNELKDFLTKRVGLTDEGADKIIENIFSNNGNNNQH